MNTIASLTGAHLRTYTTIQQHPVSHNLGWRDVHALLRHLGQVEEEPNGNLKVTRHGAMIMLHPARTKDVAGTEELMELRHFLARSEAGAAGVPGTAPAWLLVIDHHVARIFRTELSGSLPLEIFPHEPDDYFRHAHNSKDFTRGQEKPDPNSFFEPVAHALRTGGSILVFGTGTGMSSEMDQFLVWVKQHHPELAGRIIGSVVIDESHLSPGQLVARAREFYAHSGRARG